MTNCVNCVISYRVIKYYSRACLWSAQKGKVLFGSALKGGHSHLGREGGDYVDLAKIHSQWWLFVRICFIIKKLISPGSILVSVCGSAFLFLLSALFILYSVFFNLNHIKGYNIMHYNMFSFNYLNWIPKHGTWCFDPFCLIMMTQTSVTINNIIWEVAQHCVQLSCPLCGETLLCVLSTSMEVNCTLFDNILLAGSATGGLCQSVQGTLAVSTPLLLLRIINGMLMCSGVNALCLRGIVIDSNVLIKWNFTAD